MCRRRLVSNESPGKAEGFKRLWEDLGDFRIVAGYNMESIVNRGLHAYMIWQLAQLCPHFNLVQKHRVADLDFSVLLMDIAHNDRWIEDHSADITDQLVAIVNPRICGAAIFRQREAAAGIGLEPTDTSFLKSSQCILAFWPWYTRFHALLAQV